MANTAVSAGEPETGSDAPSVTASNKKKDPAQPRPERSKRARARKAVGAKRPSSEPSETALAKPAATPMERGKTQVGTLLVGAGIGAALTLSVVAFGTKRGRGSVFALAITKSLSYVIARTSARGSLLNIVAQAVGSAIA